MAKNVGPNSPRIRNRPAVSCSVCRARKVKCDRQIPCGFCRNKQLEHLCVVPQLPETKTRKLQKNTIVQSAKVNAPSSSTGKRIPNSSVAQKNQIRKPLHEPVPTAIGVIAYLDSQNDTIFDRILSKEPGIYAGGSCSCDDDYAGPVQKCLVHSPASRHFLTLFSKNEAEDTTVPVSDPFLSGMEEWTHRKSLIIPEIRDLSKKRDLESIYSALPPFSTLEKCLDYYFTKMNWCWGTVFPETFYGSFEAFKDLLSGDSSIASKYVFIDPAFVSLVLAIVATVVCVFQNSFEIQFPVAMENDNLDDFVMKMYKASAKALDVAEWLERPSMRSIQAAILLSDFCSLYYGHDKGAGESYIILSYRNCFKLNYQSEEFHLGTKTPYDPCLPPHNILMNREIRRRILVSVTIRYARDSISGCFRSESKIADIPLPLNCRLKSIMKPEYANMNEQMVNALDETQIQTRLYEITDACWLNLTHHSLITTAQAVYEKYQHLGIMEFLEQLEKSFAASFITERGLIDESVLNPITHEFSSERAMKILMHYDASQRSSPSDKITDCFSTLIVTKSILNMHEGFFAIHLRTGNYPLSAYRVITASRQILRLEYVLKTSPVVRMRTHISCLQRAVIMLFMAFLLKSEYGDLIESNDSSITQRTQRGLFQVESGRYPSSDGEFEKAKRRLAGVLRDEDLAGDLELLKSLEVEISFTSQLPGKVQSDRASISARLLRLLKYFISCIEVKLGSQGLANAKKHQSQWHSSAVPENDPIASDPELGSGTGPRGMSSEFGAPVISLPEILALTDDFTSCMPGGSVTDNFFSMYDVDIEKIDTLGFLSLL